MYVCVFLVGVFKQIYMYYYYTFLMCVLLFVSDFIWDNKKNNKSILSQTTDLFNGPIKYYLKIYIH